MAFHATLSWLISSSFTFASSSVDPFLPCLALQMFTVLRRFSILMTMLMERYILKSASSQMVQVSVRVFSAVEKAAIPSRAVFIICLISCQQLVVEGRRVSSRGHKRFFLVFLRPKIIPASGLSPLSWGCCDDASVSCCDDAGLV